MSNQQLTPRVTAAGSGIGRASGFELTSPAQPGAANVEAALERNRAFAAAGGHQGAVVFPNLSAVRDHLPRSARRPRALPRPRPQRRDGRPQRRRAGHPGGDQRCRLHRPARRDRPARRPAVRGRRDPPHPVRNRRARRRHLPPPLRAADRRRRVDPARARRPRPGGDRHPRRRAPALRTRDLPARHRLRARLRRRHRPGARRSSPPAAEQIEPSDNPNHPKDTKHQ